ncbi:MAG: protein kinase [Deltaproteobacteria bacterium]|nr:protein kinase [Deltaproteobacteria bacterium]
MSDTTIPRARRTIAERYELLDVLGSGGMGRVWHAYDTRLKRDVAIKTLNAVGAKATSKLVQEAQAQARVEHPHVCRIYEVGWDELGEPFIVMQLISGKTLSDVAQTLSLEQRVKAVKNISEAVHEANRNGVIHRDLKPSNVLMEPQPEGGFKACVTDFGLAREATDSLETRTGSVVGTPQYMAPEQARGETSLIDRRTDVYGLGAMLYEVLSGMMPFEGNAYDILNQVLAGSPIPILKRQPALPRDLAVIVGKCMERDQRRRYDSARALADDLQRWLDGAAILARPPSLTYRLRRFVGRHPIAIAVPLVLLLLGGLAQATFWRTRSKAREVAARFGQDVKEIEGAMSLALILPLHDTTAEENKVRTRMARLDREMLLLGREGLGPGNYALGRGYLALGETERARDAFQKAWDAGYTTPETATGLGRALVDLYETALRDNARLEDPALRQRKKKELMKSLREPAMAALREGAGATTEPAEYVEALLRFCDEDLDGAEAMAKEAILRAPWLYEGRLLLGRIARERGQRKRAAGDEAGADAEFREAQEPLEIAVQIGRSDPRAWSELCGLWMDVVAQPSYRSAEAPQEMFTACHNAVTAAPNRVNSWVQLAGAHRTWAEALQRVGKPEEADELVSAGQDAKHALALDPQSAAAHLVRGLALHRLSRIEDQEGRDPGPALEKSIDELQRAFELEPENVQLASQLGTAMGERAQNLFDQARDPTGSLERAAQLLTRAFAMDPLYLVPQADLGRVRQLQARWQAERGVDPLAALDDAQRAWRQAGLSETSTQIGLARTDLQRAEWQLEVGADATATFTEAADLLGRLTGAGRAGEVAIDVARLHWLRARQEQLSGRDPTKEITEARAAMETSPRSGPLARQALLLSARLDLLAARALATRKATGAEQLLDHGVSSVELALEGWRAPGRALLLKGELELQRARVLAQRKLLAGEWFLRAAHTLDRALPDDAPRVILTRGRLHLWKAEWLRAEGFPVGDELKGARRALDAAKERGQQLVDWSALFAECAALEKQP